MEPVSLGNALLRRVFTVILFGRLGAPRPYFQQSRSDLVNEGLWRTFDDQPYGTESHCDVACACHCPADYSALLS